MKCAICLIAAFALVTAITEPVFGDPEDPFWGPVGSTPDNPYWTGTGWSWLGWNTGTPPNGTVIPPWSFIYIGLENLYMGDDWSKDFYVEFETDFPQCLHMANNCSGFGPGPHQGQTQGGSGTMGPNPNQPTNPYALQIRIHYDIQPDWEWVKIENHCEFQDVQVGEFTVHSECIPEPTTLSLLAVGGCALLRRRTA